MTKYDLDNPYISFGGCSEWYVKTPQVRLSTQTTKSCEYHSEINGGLCLKSGDGCDSPFGACGFAKEEVKA